MKKTSMRCEIAAHGELLLMEGLLAYAKKHTCHALIELALAHARLPVVPDTPTALRRFAHVHLSTYVRSELGTAVANAWLSELDRLCA